MTHVVKDPKEAARKLWIYVGRKGAKMPVHYSEDSAGPGTRQAQEYGSHYYEDIDTTGAAVLLAAELGVDLTTVVGTGKGGRITKADVEKAGA